MIRLSVEKYCQECPEFEPVLDKLDIETFIGEHETRVLVLCKYRKRCAAMMRYLEKIKEGEKKENGCVPREISDADGK